MVTSGGTKQYVISASIVTIIFGIAISYFFISIALSKTDDFYEFCTKAVGKLLTRVIFMFYLLAFIIYNAAYTRDFSGVIHMYILPRIPLPFFSIVMIMVLVVYISYKGITILGRVSEILFIVVYSTVIVIFLISLNQLNFNFLMPVFNGALKPSIYGAIAQAPQYEDLMLWLFILPQLKDRKDIKKWMPLSVLVSGIFVITASSVIIGFFGAPLAKKFYYPFYYLLRSIKISENISGFDILFIPIWYITSFIKLSLYFFAELYIIKRLFNLISFKQYVIPLALLITSLSVIMFQSQKDLITFLSINVLGVITPVFFIFVPLFISLIYLIRMRYTNSKKV